MVALVHERLKPCEQMYGADSKNTDDAEQASRKLQLKALYDDFRNRLIKMAKNQQFLTWQHAIDTYDEKENLQRQFII